MVAIHVVCLFLFLALALGALCGWWVGLRVRTSDKPPGESRRIRDALISLNRMADEVMSDVRSHQQSIADLAEELAILDVKEAKSVAAVVRRLVEANQAMEHRLVVAETKLGEQARELEAKASEACTDGLTQLANRRAFNDELARRFEEHERLQRPLSVILLDVDRFKNFNDTHGHQVGDEVLRGVAATLRHTMRGMDLVARYGGEEFGIVLPNTPLVVASTVAERAREALAAREFRYDGQVYRITVSLGVAQLRSTEQVATLLHRADEALYMSKANGRDCSHFHDGRKILKVGCTVESNASDPLEVCPPSFKTAKRNRANGSSTTNSPLAGPAKTGSDDRAAEELASSSFLKGFLRRRLAEWKRGGKVLTVAMIRVNDVDKMAAEYGAATGELMVQTVARQLSSAVREMDSFGQYNEHCFVVMLPGTAEAQAALAIERIQRDIAECAVLRDGVTIRLSVCIGVTEVMEGDDVIRLLERAYQTMEASRDAGGACPFVYKGNWPVPMTGLASV